MFNTTSARFTLLVLSIAVICSGGCDGQRTVSDRSLEFIDAPRLSELIAEAEAEPGKSRLLLIDPRDEISFANAHLPGAQNVRLVDVPLDRGRDPAIERFKNIVVYGDHPSDPPAKGIAKRFLRMKYDNVLLYDGGLMDWTSRGLPTERIEGPLPGTSEP